MISATPAAAIDTNESARRKAVGIGGFGAAVERWQADAQHETAAGGDTGLEKGPAGDGTMRAGGRLIEPHVQPPCPVVLARAACLMAWRIRT